MLYASTSIYERLGELHYALPTHIIAYTFISSESDKPEKMERDLYMAAMNGNVDFFNEVRHREIENGCCDSYLLSLTPQKNNILHIASHYDQFDFMKSGFNSLNFSPLMIIERNATGDTPLHVASKRGNKKIVKLLVDAINKLVVREVLVSEDDYDQQRPWKIRNLEGNTPLHEALINGKVEVAKYLLVEVDPQVASVVNNTGETPLHLAIKHNVNGMLLLFLLGKIDLNILNCSSNAPNITNYD